MVVARILGKTQFGELAMLRSTTMAFAMIACLGLAQTSTKHIAGFRSKEPQRAAKVLGLSLVVTAISSIIFAVIFFIGSSHISETFFHASHLASGLRIVSLLIIGTALNRIQTSILAGFEAFRQIAICSFVRGFAGGSIFVLGAYFGGINGALLGLVGSLAVNCIISYLFISLQAEKAGIRPSYTNFGSELHLLWKYALPVLICVMTVAPVEWIANAMLGRQQNGYAELGMFQAARQWLIVIVFIPQMLGQVLLPLLSNLWSLRKRKAFIKVLITTMSITAGIVFSFAIPIALFSPKIMMIYGKDFSGAPHILIIICGVSVIKSLNVIIIQVFWSLGAVKLAVVANVLRAVSILTLFYLWGMTNAGTLALAYLSGGTVSFVFQGVCLFCILRSLREPTDEIQVQVT